MIPDRQHLESLTRAELQVMAKVSPQPSIAVGGMADVGRIDAQGQSELEVRRNHREAARTEIRQRCRVPEFSAANAQHDSRCTSIFATVLFSDSPGCHPSRGLTRYTHISQRTPDTQQPRAFSTKEARRTGHCHTRGQGEDICGSDERQGPLYPPEHRSREADVFL